MKILYAIQGTGNGHLSRAMEIIPLLQKRCETDILISGYQTNLELPWPVKYRLHGLSFMLGKNGGIDLRKTYKKANMRLLLKEINELPVYEYDFILNDFEPVSAWACYKNKIPCIALSHQSSLLDKNSPRPSLGDSIGSFILKNYAPASHYLGLHFCRYSKNIFTPVIRKEIRAADKTDGGYYTVYLPAFDENVITEILEQIPETSWQVFSGTCTKSKIRNNITIKPVDQQSFFKSLVNCRGVLCGAGFETPAEALFLGKKLMVIPMQNQFEQQFNATALKGLGVPVLKKFKSANTEKIRDWVISDFRIEISYPDITDRIINRIFEMYVEGKFPKKKWSKSFKIKPAKGIMV